MRHKSYAIYQELYEHKLLYIFVIQRKGSRENVKGIFRGGFTRITALRVLIKRNDDTEMYSYAIQLK